MSSSEMFTILVYALLVWGVIGIILRLMGWIRWHAVWVTLPIMLAVVIYVIMLIIAAAKGGGFRG